MPMETQKTPQFSTATLHFLEPSRIGALWDMPDPRVTSTTRADAATTTNQRIKDSASQRDSSLQDRFLDQIHLWFGSSRAQDVTFDVARFGPAILPRAASRLLLCFARLWP